ncbi:MAG TPA: hypothetical protein PK357_02785 [Candidatus Pacearchaeota archaeon]|nr:hypothetical protein [Candidatus Pacearchaeota archaeon]
MVVEEYYSPGLNAFLSGKVDSKEVVKTAKSVLYSGGSIFILGALLKIAIVYGGKVAATGNWHPFKYESKYKIKQVDAFSERGKLINNLENKTLNYYDILK